METTYQNFKIKSVFTGEKNWSDVNTENWNHHLISVTNTTTKTKISFDFWASIAHPKFTKEKDLLFAFYCLVNDAMCGKQSFNDFCGEFGYDNDSIKAKKTHKACKKALTKFEKIYAGDIYDFANALQEVAD